MTSALRVVVVTYSPGPTLDGLLRSLPAATQRRTDVVLVDNGSDDGVPEAAAVAEGVTLLRAGGNVGYGAAANAGLADRRSGWALVSNPDVELRPGSVDELLAAAERWPRAAVIGPRIVTSEGDVYPSARDLPSLPDGTGHAALGWVWPGNPWTVRYRREDETIRERTAGWLSGSCLLVWLDAFHAVGGFDPGYFMYFEDVDLGRRLGEAGYLSVYAPSATVVHSGGHATQRQAHRMQRVHHTSALRYLSQEYPRRRHLPLRVALRAGLGARMLISQVNGRVARGARFRRLAP